MKTIDEIQGEVQQIIKDHIHLEGRLAALRSKGYTGITFTWVKCGGIGSAFYLKRKRIYRIQVSASEFRGKYPIAYCVEVPVMEI